MAVETQHRQLLDALASGVRTMKELVAIFGISQPTLSRRFSAIGAQVLKLGKGVATCYGLPREVARVGSLIPVYRISEAGEIQVVGELRVLVANQYWWVPAEAGKKPELFQGLPWFIQAMRPEGFMGRAFAYRHGEDLELPADLKYWNDDHVLLALSICGDDCPGNLIIGDGALQRYRHRYRYPSLPLEEGSCFQAYPRLAQAALLGEAPGSSAGGEQPKFDLMIDREGEIRHALVKFSSKMDSAEGRRWGDLLVCEHLAQGLIAEKGIAAASSRVDVIGDQVFLESIRFDRVGPHGRMPMISLGVVDSEFVGEHRNWPLTAGHLEQMGMIASEDADSIRWLYNFGQLIANTDMHFGNLSLFMVEGRYRFRLAPVYDMLPMFYSPKRQIVRELSFSIPSAVSGTARHRDDALCWALELWRRASRDSRISEGFRQICHDNSRLVEVMNEGPKISG